MSRTLHRSRGDKAGNPDRRMRSHGSQTHDSNRYHGNVPSPRKTGPGLVTPRGSVMGLVDVFAGVSRIACCELFAPSASHHLSVGTSSSARSSSTRHVAPSIFGNPQAEFATDRDGLPSNPSRAAWSHWESAARRPYPRPCSSMGSSESFRIPAVLKPAYATGFFSSIYSFEKSRTGGRSKELVWSPQQNCGGVQ